MVFSKDAYSSDRYEITSKEKQGDLTPIFTHFLSGVFQRERRLSCRRGVKMLSYFVLPKGLTLYMGTRLIDLRDYFIDKERKKENDEKALKF